MINIFNYKNLLYLSIFGIAFVLGVYVDNKIMSSDIKEKDLQISNLKLEQAKESIVIANESLIRLNEASKIINDKAKEFQSIKIDINTRLDGIKKDLKNVKTPLPVDCKPDVERMRIMSEAVDSIKQSSSR